MAFEKEHAIGDEYFFCHSQNNRGLTYNVSTSQISYFIKYKKADPINIDKLLKIFKDYYGEYDLAAEGWDEFNYFIRSTADWTDYDFELCIYAKQFFFGKMESKIFDLFDDYACLGPSARIYSGWKLPLFQILCFYQRRN